jgi:hypothetical protein
VGSYTAPWGDVQVACVLDEFDEAAVVAALPSGRAHPAVVNAAD